MALRVKTDELSDPPGPDVAMFEQHFYTRVTVPPTEMLSTAIYFLFLFFLKHAFRFVFLELQVKGQDQLQVSFSTSRHFGR